MSAEELEHYGIQGYIHSWIKAFLTNRTQQVLVEGSTSNSIQVISGVPQGIVVGPLFFFLLSISDLPDCVQWNTKLFPDDCILNRRITSQEDWQIL